MTDTFKAKIDVYTTNIAHFFLFDLHENAQNSPVGLFLENAQNIRVVCDNVRKN